jgi:NADP-dependent 3-hydroxy acid dehydrogenase YdfG
LLTSDQLAEYVIWAVLQPPAVDVNTIIFRRCGATI